ncbi:MAG: tol-pal system protein YbgF [Gemmatimonadetes bacterium]|nr:tol-pal system protein YbgF [Gemmatimonadota bacterium]
MRIGAVGGPGRAPGPCALLLAAVALLAGCGATREDFVRLESAGADQHAQVRQEVAALRQSFEQLSSAVRQLRADFDARLDEVNNRVGIVESLMRDNEQMFQRFQRRLQESQQRQQETEEGLEEQAPSDTGRASRERPAGSARGDSAGAPGDPGGRSRAGTGGASEIDLYNGALNDYQAGRFDLALAGFREYLRLYPDGTSPDNAQFWVGRIHLDEEQYDAAIREFERLLASYPETDKAAQATFYLGNANRGLGNKERARAYYREVIERYPASQESQLARRELDR